MVSNCSNCGSRASNERKHFLKCPLSQSSSPKVPIPHLTSSVVVTEKKFDKGYSFVDNSFLANLFCYIKHSPKAGDIFSSNNSLRYCGGNFLFVFFSSFSFAVVELIFFNELGTFSSVAVKGQGGAAIIECVCSRCNIKERYCSSKAAGGYLDITKRISSASFLCGGTPTSAVRFLSTINASHPSRNTITRCYSKIRNIVVTQTDAIMEAAQQEYLAKNGNKWIISLDFTWDSRNKGKFKVIIFDFIKIC